MGTTATTARTVKKAVFITGCDSGFGFSLVTHMLENSRGTYRDYIVIAGCFNPGGDRTGAEMLQGAATAAKKIDDFHLIQIDVTSSESIRNARDEIKNIVSSSGEAQLWALVNNAATLVFADAVFQTEDMFRRQFDVNVVGAWAMSKALMPQLMESKGRIINMISFCTTCPLPTLAVYTSTKAALLRLSEGMRAELTKFNVDVVLFNPGDHPKATPLCAFQQQNYKAMAPEVNLDYEQNPTVLRYFRGIEEKFCQQFPPPTLKKLDDPGFYCQADRALTDRVPSHFYVNAPWITRLFFWLVDKLPSRWGDRARTAIMMLPK